MAFYKLLAPREPKNTTCYGLELEFSNKATLLYDKKSEKTSRVNQDNDSLKDLKEIKKHFSHGTEKDIIFKFNLDGGGIEVAFQPMSIKRFYKEKNNINKIISFLRKKGYNTVNPYSGMHVHIGTDSISNDVAYSFLSFLSDNKDLVRIISGRSFFHSFGSTISIAKPETHVDLLKSKRYGCGYAINRKDIPTLEIRIFNSSMNFNTIMARIEFIDSYINSKLLDEYWGKMKSVIFNGDKSIESIGALNFIAGVLRNYIKKGENKNLIKYLISKKIIDLYTIQNTIHQYRSNNLHNPLAYATTAEEQNVLKKYKIKIHKFLNSPRHGGRLSNNEVIDVRNAILKSCS